MLARRSTDAGRTLAGRWQDGGRDEMLAQVPLYFIENRGQLDSSVAFYVQGADATLHFTADGVTYSLVGEAPPAPVKAVVAKEKRATLAAGDAQCWQPFSPGEVHP